VIFLQTFNPTSTVYESNIPNMSNIPIVTPYLGPPPPGISIIDIIVAYPVFAIIIIAYVLAMLILTINMLKERHKKK
jgi:hypothetical protein